MASLTIFGGVGAIGGNKILLESNEGNLLLDFGRSMGLSGNYYAEFIQPRSKNAFRDLYRLGVLPGIDGIYSASFLDNTKLLFNSQDKAKIPLSRAPDYWVTESLKPYDPKNPKVDAVFITHAHFDHIQDVSFLDPAIPVHSSEETSPS
jgi:ribonuclease J